MTRRGRLRTRAKPRFRLLVVVLTALVSLLGFVCCEAGGHQNKIAPEAVEHDVGWDPKRDPPVERIKHSSHGDDQVT